MSRTDVRRSNAAENAGVHEQSCTPVHPHFCEHDRAGSTPQSTGRVSKIVLDHHQVVDSELAGFAPRHSIDRLPARCARPRRLGPCLMVMCLAHDDSAHASWSCVSPARVTCWDDARHRGAGSDKTARADARTRPWDSTRWVRRDRPRVGENRWRLLVRLGRVGFARVLTHRRCALTQRRGRVELG